MTGRLPHPGEFSGSRQRTITSFPVGGRGVTRRGGTQVEQPRTARLDAAVGGAAPHGDAIHHVTALTFHSRSSRGDPPLSPSFRTVLGLAVPVALASDVPYPSIGR